MIKLCSEIARCLYSPATPRSLMCREFSHSRVLLDATSSGKDESTSTQSTIKLDKLYHMEEIGYLTIVSRLKIYQGVGSTISIPVAYIAEIMNFVPSGVTATAIAMSITSLSMLSAFSAVVSHTIGIIYVCPKNVNMRFSYLDFWGRRNNYDTTIENIADTHEKIAFGFCQKVKFRDGAKPLKLATRHGSINDDIFYEKIFGRLDK